MQGAEAQTNYPVKGATLRHAHEQRPINWTVISVDLHSDPRKTKQRAITLRCDDGRQQIFEVSPKVFWFNWQPTERN